MCLFEAKTAIHSRVAGWFAFQDFITEIDICCDLNHPNLVRLLGYADNPELYMVRTKIPNPHPISSSFIQIEIETISCSS